MALRLLGDRWLCHLAVTLPLWLAPATGRKCLVDIGLQGLPHDVMPGQLAPIGQPVQALHQLRVKQQQDAATVRHNPFGRPAWGPFGDDSAP